MDASKGAFLPTSSVPAAPRRREHRRNSRLLLAFVLLLVASASLYLHLSRAAVARRPAEVVPLDADEILAKCRSLKLTPAPPADFHTRTESDRFQPGTEAVLIRNATIWTGDDHGTQVVHGDVLLDKGIIRAVGEVFPVVMNKYQSITTIDAHGSWLTPGIVDLHSHVGVGPSPALAGAEDGNSWKGPIVPWLRALDAFNTRDDSYTDSMSGGVTTSLVLPGSLNAIAGLGFVMKLRPTLERSPTSMLLEPPFGFNASEHAPIDAPPRWGHMKHACGENPKNYGDVRMDTVWRVRDAYDTARTIMRAQDDYCEKVSEGDWRGLAGKKFPEELQWTPLVEILRGKVKVQAHCYEAVDLDNFVRLSNEFKFEIAAFHHAHETYLVPEVLKRAYGKPPACAMFSSFSRYKRESYRHSEFAPRILADEGLDVVMKSDHPGVLSRQLLQEAAIAHYFGLPDSLALASVTTTPAQVLGLEHRIGYVKEGFDADVVLWDSHPLALGATPKQVIVDGIVQFPHAREAPKAHSRQHSPSTPNFDRERVATLKYDGLPPLKSKPHHAIVAFTNVSHVWMRDDTDMIVDILTRHSSLDPEESSNGVVVVSEGRITCSGTCDLHAPSLANAAVVDLQGGAIQPGLVNFGANLGMTEIPMEDSTRDGAIADPLTDGQPSLFGTGGFMAKAADGLMFGTRDALLAYRAGVTVSVSTPISSGWLGGLSTAFSLGAPHKLATGALVRDVAAVHCALVRGGASSVSTMVAAMRRLLTGEVKGEIGEWFAKVAQGKIPLVVDVHSADIIATLIVLKKEVEAKTGAPMKLTIAGATESHLLAAELAEADVGVIVAPGRSFPYTWDERRVLPGPPVSNNSLIGHLLKHNITVGIGPRGWVLLATRPTPRWRTRGRGTCASIKKGAFALATVNMEKLLGLEGKPNEQDLVATVGGDLLGYQGKVIAAISPRRSVVDIF
ncbi:uncharacterized protein BXZ73DRAFT_47982 [Epithele typhae]|uniref:uncharacterized protein n=1 Tax=Epithele typhae TaxID=378194 RepID=UPI002008329D|nr:uncharacterized protein BXZ73DRAFT_47982 [Epithele typhae]KAH9929527.1 hypothetical protein BXZ73DRAFT_47982 [Epithele typhae]